MTRMFYFIKQINFNLNKNDGWRLDYSNYIDSDEPFNCFVNERAKPNQPGFSCPEVILWGEVKEKDFMGIYFFPLLKGKKMSGGRMNGACQIANSDHFYNYYCIPEHDRTVSSVPGGAKKTLQFLISDLQNELSLSVNKDG